MASGWNHGRLSERGREAAIDLGARRRGDGISLVFASDLRRAAETAETAFEDSGIPILLDWRLRECDYGDLNGAPAERVHGERVRYIDAPYPRGESWKEAVTRVGWFVRDLHPRWAGTRCLIIGHIATRWGLEHYLNGRQLEELAAEEFSWQPGWEYTLA